MPRKKDTRAEIEYQVQDVIPFLHRHYGFPNVNDKRNVRMLSVPVKMGATIKKPDVVYYYNDYPVFIIECKKPGQKDEDTLGQAFSYVRNFPNYDPQWSKDGTKPRFFGTFIDREFSFYEVIYKTIRGSIVDEPKPIKHLTFDFILKKCRLLKAEKQKPISIDDFIHFLYELADIFDIRRKRIVSRKIIKAISSVIKSYLTFKEEFVTHEPYYLKLNRHPQRQRRLLDLLYTFNLLKYSGPDIAKEFRTFIIRAFQGKEFNQYLTPLPVISFMLDITGKIKRSEKILDFECGSGGFLAEAVHRGKLKLNKIKGIDIEKLPCLIAKTYLALYFKIKGKKADKIPIINKNGLFYFGKNWDIVIGNPGGSDVYELGDMDKILTRGLINLKGNEHQFSEYELSVQQAIRSVKPNGRICLILPDSLFSNSSAAYIRQHIYNHCHIKAIVGLPRGTFDAGTEVSETRKGAMKRGQKMSVLLLTKRKTLSNLKQKSNLFIAGIKNFKKDSFGNELKIIYNYFLKSGV